MTGLALEAAARALGVSVPTLRRWVAQGCPCVQRGRRGRGHALLLGPTMVLEWGQAGDVEAHALALSRLIPEALGEALALTLQEARDIDKRRLAGVLCGGWYLSASAVLDLLRARNSAVAEEPIEPASIERLRKIAGI